MGSCRGDMVVPLSFLGHVVFFCASCSCLAFGVVVEVVIEKMAVEK